MNIWLITVGEPLPTDSDDVRLYRTGLMAQMLAKEHEVVWITSRFDHVGKRQRVLQRETSGNGYTTVLLDGVSYDRNVSLARLRNHLQIGTDFREYSRAGKRPDIILCSFPTIELSLEAVRYGKVNRIPVVLDVRDLWPDIFVDVLPVRLRFFGKLLLKKYIGWTAESFRDCDAITGVSQNYMSWGLDYGDKVQGKNDQVFPLGYPSIPQYSADEIASVFRQFDLDADIPTLLFIGTFGRTYDLSSALEGYKNLVKQGEQLQFILCGEGELRSKWEGLSRGLDGVRFTGWLGAKSLHCLMLGSSVGVASYAPDAPQGIPNKVLEYMAGRLPILSSLVGETEAILAQHSLGLTYDPKSAESFESNVIKLLSPSVSQEYSENARLYFENHFSAESVYSEFKEYLLELSQTSKISDN